MENPNEQFQSFIINLLVRYGSLNSIYNEVFETKKLAVSQQRIIYNFHKDFKNTELFETELLSFLLSDNQTKNLNIVNLLKSKIQSSISLYDENSLFVSKINVYEVCYRYVENLYKDRIKLLSDCVGEYKKIRRELDRELDSSFLEPISKEKKAGIWIEIKRLEALEIKVQGELDIIYNEWKTEQDIVLKYQQNVFNDIQELGFRFISIINNYYSGIRKINILLEKPKVILEESEEPAADEMKKANALFMKGMYKNFLLLEKKLIEDEYLNVEKYWIARNRNKTQDNKSLVTFLVGLLENKYFLPNKDPEIKVFFQNRYQIDLGQNFEKKRRESSIDIYKIKFSDYNF